jgi:DNA repair exonuclease SbcCD ATPase subunit
LLSVLQEMTEDVTLRARKTSGQMSWLKAALEHSSAVQHEERAQSRETVEALRVRIRALEDIVREKDESLRSCESSKNELAERIKRLDIEAETRTVDLDMKDRRASRLEDSVQDLTAQVKALERVREENAALRREIDERERDARELERQVEAYRATARAAENRQATAELAAAKSERLVKQYLSTPTGEDRLRLENRLGALSEKLSDLSQKETRVARFRACLAEELASSRHALKLEHLRAKALERELESKIDGSKSF